MLVKLSLKPIAPEGSVIVGYTVLKSILSRISDNVFSRKSAAVVPCTKSPIVDGIFNVEGDNGVNFNCKSLVLLSALVTLYLSASADVYSSAFLTCSIDLTASFETSETFLIASDSFLSASFRDVALFMKSTSLFATYVSPSNPERFVILVLTPSNADETLSSEAPDSSKNIFLVSSFT